MQFYEMLLYCPPGQLDYLDSIVQKRNRRWRYQDCNSGTRTSLFLSLPVYFLRCMYFAQSDLVSLLSAAYVDGQRMIGVESKSITLTVMENAVPLSVVISH